MFCVRQSLPGEYDLHDVSIFYTAVYCSVTTVQPSFHIGYFFLSSKGRFTYVLPLTIKNKS